MSPGENWTSRAVLPSSNQKPWWPRRQKRSTAPSTVKPSTAGAGRPDSTLALGGLAARWPFGRLPLARVAARPAAARLALGFMVLGTFVVAALATGRQNTLVPSSYLAYPRWESGPLHGITRHLP